MSSSEKLELLISAKNTADSALKDARSDVRALERQVRKATDAFEATGSGRRDLDKLIDSLEEARLESKRLSAAATDAKGDITKFGTSAQTAGRKTSGMSRSMDKGRQSGKSLAVGWGKMVGVFAAVTAGVAAASGAFRLLGDSVNEARAARKASAQTAAVMRSMGRTEAPKAIDKMIDGLSRIAGIDDDELRSMTNIMLTFGNVTGSTFKDANAAALDLSVAFGKDLESSAVMVGKALNDPLKGLTALTRVGVSFTKEQQDQVKAMMEVGDTAGAQGIIMKELQKQVGGSAAAQADSIGKAQVAWGNLKEAVGEVLMSIGTGDMDIVGALEDATKWIKQNKDTIVSVFQTIIGFTFQAISIWLKWESIILKTFGYLFGAMATTLGVLAKLGLVSQNTADSVKGLADGFGQASEKADKASKWFKNASENAFGAAGASQRLKEKLRGVGIEIDNLNKKDLKILRDTPIPGVNRQGGIPTEGDTATPRSHGSLPSLMSAHRGLDAGIPGSRTITSSLRFHNLGSPGSDHARGRALDLTGPGLNAYAQRVRAGGGYAAFHGSGPSRHLHAVPGGAGSGHVTQVFDVDVHAEHGVDVIAALRTAQRQASLAARERGV